MRSIIHNVVDVWNVTSQGPSWLYDGPWPADMVDDEFFCSAVPNKPAVLFLYTDACIPEAQGDCWEDAIGLFSRSNACDDVAYITIPATRFSDDEDCRGAADWEDSNMRWLVGSQLDALSGTSLFQTLIHEVGHAMRLGHPSCEESVMYVGSGFRRGGRQLFGHDKECSLDVTFGRRLRYSYRYWELGGLNTWYDYVDYTESEWFMTKSGVAGGYIDVPSEHFGLFGDLSFPLSSAGNTTYRMSADGPINFSNLEYFPTFKHYVMPTVTKGFGLSGFSDVQMTYAFDDGPGGFDPPFVRSTNTDGFSTFSDYELGQCDPDPVNGGCKETPRDLRTAMPVARTLDLQTDLPLFFWLRTTRSGAPGNGWGSGGAIAANAGYRDAPEVLNFRALPTMTLDDVVPLSPVSGWDFVGGTDFPIGVACAEEPVLQSGENCILAWQDRGVPGGHILYTFFEIVGGDQWTVYEPEFSETVYYLDAGAAGGVAAAFFSGSFHLAFKAPVGQLEGEAIRHFILQSAPDDWFSLPVATLDVVEPPTFHYSRIADHAILSWAEVSP